MIDRPLSAVFFDIGGTLWHSKSPPSPAEFREIAAARAHEFLSRRGLDGFRAAEFARIAWDTLNQGMHNTRHTDLREPNYPALVAAALADAGLSLDVDVAGEFLDAIYVSGAAGGKAAYPEAPAVLRELKVRGFRISSVTNRAFGGRRFRDDLKEAGLDCGWDAHSVSVEVGFIKPHEAIFQHALNALNVRPENVLMVGDSLAEDIAGAAGLGMATAWRRSPPDTEGVEPDITIDDLTELLAIPALAHAR